MAIRVLLFFLVSLLLFHDLFSISSSFASPDGRRDLLAYIPASKKVSGKGGDRIANCREIGSRIECVKNSKWCRWCRSESLDDMCFGSSEAWRLPHQVFSCDPTA